jgi:hypothetical protein
MTCAHDKRKSANFCENNMREWICIKCGNIELQKVSDLDKFLLKRGINADTIQISYEKSKEINDRINEEMRKFRRKLKKKFHQSEIESQKLFINA